MKSEIILSLYRSNEAIPSAYNSIEARFQILPSLYLKGSPVKKEGSILYVDTYQHGDVANVSHETSFSSKKKRNWNKPHPFPSDLAKIYKAVDKSKRVVLGKNSDPFMWMDNKYGLTKALLGRLVSSFNGSLEINTRSDLVAHDDYVALLTQLPNVTVRMFIPIGPEYKCRLTEPGAPSKKRRILALKKLKEAGIRIESFEKKQE